MSDTYFAVHDGTLYLEHHGIKGQKWGVRRFQNKNGSLTAAGRKRLGYSAKSVGKAVVAGGKKVFNTGVSVGKKAAGAVKEHNQKVKDKKLADKKEKVSQTREGVLKNKNLFSNQELKDLEARFKVEDELRAGKLNQGIATAKAISQYADTALKIANAAQTGGKAIKAISEGLDSMNFKKKAESKGLTAEEYRSAIDKGYLADKLTKEANAEGSVGGKKAKAGNKSSTDSDDTKKKPDDGGDKPKKPSNDDKSPDNDKPKPEAPKEDKKDFTPEGARKAFTEKALKEEADAKSSYDSAKKTHDDNKAALDKARKDSDDNFVRMATSKSEAEYDVAKAKKTAADKKVSELSEPTKASEAEAKKAKERYDKASENASVARKQSSAKSIADDVAKMMVDRDLDTGFNAAKNNRTAESDRKVALSYIKNKLNPKKAMNGAIDKVSKKISDKAFAEDEKVVKKEAEKQTKELSKRIEDGIRTGKTDVRSSIEEFYRTSYNLRGDDLKIAVDHFMDGHAYSAFMGDYGTLYLSHHGVKGQRWGVRRFQNEDGTLTDKGRKHYTKKLESLKRKQAASDAARGRLERTHKYAVGASALFGAINVGLTLGAMAVSPATTVAGIAIASAVSGSTTHATYKVAEAWEGRGTKKRKKKMNELNEKLNHDSFSVENGNLYLEHFGIKGQKWGVRRFQNPDGTRTEAGKKREAKIAAKAEKKAIKADMKAAKAAYKEKKRYDKAENLRKKEISRYERKAATEPRYKEVYEEMARRTKSDSQEQILRNSKSANAVSVGQGIVVALGFSMGGVPTPIAIATGVAVAKTMKMVNIERQRAVSTDFELTRERRERRLKEAQSIKVEHSDLLIENGTLYLEHFGLKGMKWGRRRFQNADGSLTTAGKARYGKPVENAGGGGGGGAPEEEDEETKKKIEEEAKKAGMTVEAYRKKFADKVAEIKKEANASTTPRASSKNVKQGKRKSDFIARAYKRTVGNADELAVKAGKNAEIARKRVDALKAQRDKAEPKDHDRINEEIERAGKRLSRNTSISKDAQDLGIEYRKKYVDRVQSMIDTAKSDRQKSITNAQNAEATARRKAALRSQKGVKSTLARGKETITGIKQKHRAKKSDKKYNNTVAKLTTEFADSPNGVEVLSQLSRTQKRKTGKKPAGSTVTRPIARKKKVGQGTAKPVTLGARRPSQKPNQTVGSGKIVLGKRVRRKKLRQ